ncbi:neuropeptide FF receptor 1-like [Orbicella faveolata]|uniref:neuropeptide FF receptor 1-like n=1 Tax=Orbicella faveolata TaxID=48498 RepID=UPI0009E3848D|nr:neuropeptide FF receptor 1-like [Orbicella faveolata]
MIPFSKSCETLELSVIFGCSLQEQTFHTAPQSWFALPADARIRLTFAYAVIFPIALLGNTLGLFVVLKTSSQSHRVTNLFIANMAVADLLLTVTEMPFQVASLYRLNDWIGGMLGNITYKAFFYVTPVSIAATVLTMMLITIDRFYAVFYLLKEKIFRKPKILSGTIWILSFVLMLPYPMLFQVQFNSSQNVYECLQVWPWEDPNDPTFKETRHVLKIFHSIVFVVLYALPLSIIIVIYFLICRKMCRRRIPGNATDSNRAAADKSKRKVVRLLVLIVVVFALCWFPSYVNHYLWFVRSDLYVKGMLPLEVEYFFIWFGHANSAINSCIYNLMSDKFLRELASTLAGWCPCLRRFNCPPNCQNT